MMLAKSDFPGNGMSLQGAVTPLVDQERHRLLLLVKFARDHYDLHFALAEYQGYVRGLFMSLQISAPVLVLFQVEAHRVADAAARRLDGDLSIRALAHITAEVSPCS
ncbi:hypothetical protein ELR50_02770 [Pseudomonas citronellolis]|uniref:hypothetical protein n=1 Tax=Pseudomonas citronellolis TaxID=53408 RepID=UPI0022BA1940|nr:hypothetical protein [Pseudomonas citronellolis]WBG61857.1 hypothetical protein ELR50_02710 [Pseudomonas citronellolis]WBG61868.1 hypothetical protein ELR50_02770 [Pseudomonas citronellolis]